VSPRRSGRGPCAGGPPAVFLDRDGVLNPDVGFAHRPEHAVLYDDAGPALARLQSGGFRLIVVTNQSGIARGLYDSADVLRFHCLLAERLRHYGAALDPRQDFHVCPHGPDDGCPCRKPAPGLLEEAVRRHGVDLTRSAIVGDRESDVVAGRLLGIATLRLVRDGAAVESAADVVVRSLGQAADWILARQAGRERERS
jgi:D-glycero-D-manno-heptose 1,7-bisphosphate phosphatase